MQPRSPQNQNYRDPATIIRRGGFMLLAVFCLIATLGFVALSVDVGYISLTHTDMQNTADAAALAAAQEISAAVQNAPAGVTDVVAYAREQAKQEAIHVAQLNGFTISDGDVKFGRRSWNESTEKFETEWDVFPANIVKVDIRRDNEDVTAPDAKLRLFFAGAAGGDSYAKLHANAVAFVESRDIVIVHDFSRSMNFDSHFSNEANSVLTRPAIASNLLTVWDDLKINLGDLPRMPEYLTVTETDQGIETSVTFMWNEAQVESTGTIQEVKLYYTGGGSDTFSDLSTQSDTFTGDSNLSRVTVKIAHGNGNGGGNGNGNNGHGNNADGVDVSNPGQGGGGPNGEVDQSGSFDDEMHGSETITHYGITVMFSPDRKSYQVTGTEKLIYVDSYFEGGGYQYHDMPNPSPTSTTIFENEVIDKVKIKSKVGGSYYWTTFDCSEPSGNNGNGNGNGNSNGNGGGNQIITQDFYDNNENVKEAFGLTDVSWPWYGGSWDSYIDHCRTYSKLYDNDSDGYNTEFREKYGGLTLANYLLREQAGNWECQDLWKTRHYPFHAIKEGHMLFCDFLAGLGFNDEMGMVSYDTHHRVEDQLDEPGWPQVDIRDDPITSEYTSMKNLMHYKQAAHYAYSTNMGGGLKDGIELLKEHKRAGARSTILLMTDGNTNTIDSGVDRSLPGDWNWDQLLDYDGDGNGDYYTNSSQKHYVLRLAFEAREEGMTIHTMSVGQDADRDLMRAIAHIANGHYINVPGGSSVSEMEAEVQAAFHKIASFVPPAKLMADPDLQ